LAKYKFIANISKLGRPHILTNFLLIGILNYLLTAAV